METIKQIINNILKQYEKSPDGAKKFINNYIRLLYANHIANGGKLSIEKEGALSVEDVLKRLTEITYKNPQIRG